MTEFLWLLNKTSNRPTDILICTKAVMIQLQLQDQTVKFSLLPPFPENQMNKDSISL